MDQAEVELIDEDISEAITKPAAAERPKRKAKIFLR
jgi:hypothetical protein